VPPLPRMIAGLLGAAQGLKPLAAFYMKIKAYERSLLAVSFWQNPARLIAVLSLFSDVASHIAAKESCIHGLGNGNWASKPAGRLAEMGAP
jgi:hypothetical protein